MDSRLINIFVCLFLISKSGTAQEVLEHFQTKVKTIVKPYFGQKFATYANIAKIS